MAHPRPLPDGVLDEMLVTKTRKRLEKLAGPPALMP